uniref:Transmembrane protein 234 homolog n=1 Tax=Bombyx mori TaxID=7091 RepID=A0A8R2C6A9_BOMMO|nr:transmembrane protein 234 homolog isoform X2 [Bombyx mori]
MLQELEPRNGLLMITGVLWGCTNPFIRQGTRGLRDIKSDTLVGQVRAEIWFLLSNWKYVVPWLVNQAGSLVYLAAVQRAPLSVAVPVASGVTFALTALTGAAAGLDKALDTRSALGTALVLAGTALCCWNQTSAKV